jgi:hypothetical protein
MSNKGSSVKKLGGKKVIHSQAREIVYSVYVLMQKEDSVENQLTLNQVQERVSSATGVSRASLQRIIKEEKINESQGTSFTTPQKLSPKVKTKTCVDDFDKCVIRRTINEFQLSEGECPTLNSLLQVLREKIDFKGGRWARYT